MRAEALIYFRFCQFFCCRHDCLQDLKSRRYLCSSSHAKLLASFSAPLPLYFATFGYTHSGRVISALPELIGPENFVATISFGAVPFSTHCSNDNCKL